MLFSIIPNAASYWGSLLMSLTNTIRQCASLVSQCIYCRKIRVWSKYKIYVYDSREFSFQLYYFSLDVNVRTVAALTFIRTACGNFEKHGYNILLPHPLSLGWPCTLIWLAECDMGVPEPLSSLRFALGPQFHEVLGVGSHGEWISAMPPVPAEPSTQLIYQSNTVAWASPGEISRTA